MKNPLPGPASQPHSMLPKGQNHSPSPCLKPESHAQIPRPLHTTVDVQ